MREDDVHHKMRTAQWGVSTNTIVLAFTTFHNDLDYHGTAVYTGQVPGSDTIPVNHNVRAPLCHHTVLINLFCVHTAFLPAYLPMLSLARGHFFLDLAIPVLQSCL